MSKVFHFRWKYAISAFLICGVLSLTIGGKNTPDPLLVETQALSRLVDDTFKINKTTAQKIAEGGADPSSPLASDAELDGPADRTFLETSPTLIPLVVKVKLLGQKISEESFRRGLDARNHVAGDAINAVSESVKLYAAMQLRLYRNYMRLAHEAKFKTYKSTPIWDSIVESIGVFVRSEENATAYAARKDLERWRMQYNGNSTGNGARGFSPDHYDFLNIKIDTTTAQNLYSDSSANKTYNLRHVKGEDGRFTAIELFINSFEKQMAEYDAISEPNSKEEYIKLIQFAAVSEGMTNRWAIRRMAGAAIKEKKVVRGMYDESYKSQPLKLSNPLNLKDTQYTPLSFSDSSINSCAPDLVSFRFKKNGKGTVNDIEAYSSAWQGDRHTDMMELAGTAAITSTIGKPLLSDPEYAELFATYLSAFENFTNGAVVTYAGNAEAMLAAITREFAPSIRGAEESKWSRQTVDGYENDPKVGAEGNIMAREAFFFASFPADDLSIRTVAERYADRAFQMRKFYLVSAVHEVAKQSTYEVPAVRTSQYDDPGVPVVIQTFPETNTQASEMRAFEVVENFMKGREKAWKAALAAHITNALEAKLGMDLPTANGNPAGLGYLFGQDQKRYDLYSNDLMSVAALGSRGIHVRRAAEKAQKKLESALAATRYCPPAKVEFVDGDKTITTTEPCSYIFPKLKNASDPNEYLGYAPFRHSAREHGMTDLILPEAADQLSLFFRKKMELVVSYENKFTQYAEPGISEKIAKNEVVMRGMDRLFGALAGAAEQGPGGGNDAAVSECGTTLVSADRPKVKKKDRKPSSEAGSSLTPEQCSNPGNSEAEAKRAAFEASIIPAAKKAYADFIKGLSEPGTFVDPARAKRKLEEGRVEREKRDKIRASDQAEDKKRNEMKKNSTSIANSFIPLSAQYAMERNTREEVERQRKLRDAPPKLTAVQKKTADEAAKKAAQEKIVKGTFRPGRDTSLDRTGGELFLATEKERKDAKYLYREALAMLGIAEEVTAGVPGEVAEWGLMKAGHSVGAQQVVRWVSTEHLIHQKLPKVRLLERMVATVTDQHAMGKVLVQEAIAKAPILTLQSSWKWKKSEKEEPILLEKLAGVYSPTVQWGDGSTYQNILKRTLSQAAENDQEKVETFCRANLKAFRDDDSFRTMFGAMTGVRGMLASEGKMKKWDEEVEKESRTWQKRFMEDYIDPYQMLLMALMIVVVIAQVAFTMGTGGAGAVTAPAAAALVAELAGVSGATSAVVATAATVTAQALARKFAIGLAKFLFKWLVVFQFTGNGGAVTLLFSFQSYMMIHTFNYKMPVQMGFTYELANSRIQNMQKMGRLAGVSTVDRERMNQARSELTSGFGQSSMGYMAAAGEVLQMAAFTLPGIFRTIGVTGQKVFARAVASSTAKEMKAVGTKTLPELIKEKGFSKGVAEYWQKAGAALRTGERIAVVQGTEKAKETLEVMLGNRLANEVLKDRKVLKNFYTAMKDEKLAEAARLLGLRDEKLAKALAKQLETSTMKDAGKIDALIAEKMKTTTITEMLAHLQTSPLSDLKAIEKDIDDAIAPLVETALKDGADEAAVLVYQRKTEEALLRRAFGDDLKTAAEIEVGKAHGAGWSQRQLETAALALKAKAETILSEAAVLDKYLQNLEKTAPIKGIPVQGESETAEFIRSWSSSDYVMHEKFFKKKLLIFERNTYELFDKETLKGIRKAFKDNEYLMTDWKRAKNARARAIGRLYREGVNQFYVDSTTGELGKLDYQDFQDNPEDYVVNTIRIPKPQEKGPAAGLAWKEATEKVKVGTEAAAKKAADEEIAKAVADAKGKDKMYREAKHLPPATKEEIASIERKAEALTRVKLGLPPVPPKKPAKTRKPSP